MRLLILGGTKFVGRHVAEAALAQGHALTLFHRGQTNSGLFPDAEHLTGDRDGHLKALRRRQWDTVIDVSGYIPRIVSQSLTLLRDAVPFYTFISTISVYADLSIPHQDEDAPLLALPSGAGEEITPETYGPLKVQCERLVTKAYPNKSLIIRPGLVAGPWDHTDRFTYWPLRAAQGGRMLAPGDPAQRIQYIDARDLAEWTMRMTEHSQPGTFNAVTAEPALTMAQLIDEGIQGGNTNTQPTWVDEAFLLAQNLAPWSDLPLWLPTQTTREYRGFSSISSARAVNAGLTFRPLRTTVTDTLEWAKAHGLQMPLNAGLGKQRERQILAVWKQELERRNRSATL